MDIFIGLLIIAVGAFCQSSSYVPIRKIRQWSWETYWLVQGLFAWVLLPLAGAMLAVPEGGSLCTLMSTASPFDVGMTLLFGALWGVGGLTFGLSMRYLGVALGQSVALGTCAALGTIMGPVLLNAFFPEQNALQSLTASVLIGVAVTLAGIGIIGAAGQMRTSSLSEEEQRAAVKDYNFTKGIAIALLAGFMSGCFNVGLTFGAKLHFEGTSPMFASLPATLLVTLGGFATNAAYCLWQNHANHTWADYANRRVWPGNLLFCILAGALWYSQFFGLAMGKGFLADSTQLTTFAFCILMALNVVFSNVWGIILKEWRGCTRATMAVLAAGIAVLVASCFVPQLI